MVFTQVAALDAGYTLSGRTFIQERIVENIHYKTKLLDAGIPHPGSLPHARQQIEQLFDQHPFYTSQQPDLDKTQ